MAKKMKNRTYLRLRDSKDTLDFGRLVAEQDETLVQYYVSPERYVTRAANIEDPAVFFVGPKGIGKSAILQMIRLQRAADADRIIDISPDDLAFSALANVEATSPILGDASKHQWMFKSLWDYVLALEVFRREYRDQGALASIFQRITEGRHAKEARKLLEISEGPGSHSLTSRILQLIKEIEVSGEYQGAKIAAKAGLDHTPSAGSAESFHLLSLVNSVAKRVADNLRRPYYVLIDDLDLYWSDTPVQNSFIAALFTSLRHFSRPPNLKCVVAIRENIYEALPLVDRDKFHDWVCHVEWDYNSVREMIEQRVMHKLAVSRNDIWDGLFPAGAFDLMWTHSNGRPREAIRLATLAVKGAFRDGHSRVEASDLDSAIRDFSTERIREVAAEAQYKYPNLDLLVRRMTGWPKEFPLARLKELVELIGVEIALGEGTAPQYSWAAGFAENPSGFARVLLETNVLWVKASRTDEARPYDTRSPIEITNSTWFAIHPMFGPGLGLIGA